MTRRTQNTTRHRKDTTVAQDKDAVLNKVRNLLNKTTERGASEAEAEVAIKMVHKLLEQHNLSMMDAVETQEDLRLDVMHLTTGKVRGVAYGKAWVVELAPAVAKACYCKTLFVKHGEKVIFIGSKNDVHAAHDLFQYLVTQASALLSAARRDAGLLIAGRAYTATENARYNEYSRSFLTGLARRLARRIYEHLDEQSAHNASTQSGALVRLVDERNDAYISDFWGPTLRTFKQKEKVRHGSAYYEGAGAANLIDLTSPNRIMEEA